MYEYMSWHVLLACTVGMCCTDCIVPFLHYRRGNLYDMGTVGNGGDFGEIIKKLHFLVWWKARQRATHATPHLSASRYRTFSTCWTASAVRKCEIYLRESLAGAG